LFSAFKELMPGMVIHF